MNSFFELALAGIIGLIVMALNSRVSGYFEVVLYVIGVLITIISFVMILSVYGPIIAHLILS